MAKETKPDGSESNAAPPMQLNVSHEPNDEKRLAIGSAQWTKPGPRPAHGHWTATVCVNYDGFADRDRLVTRAMRACIDPRSRGPRCRQPGNHGGNRRSAGCRAHPSRVLGGGAFLGLARRAAGSGRTGGRSGA
jgi:hypothetical protein